MSETSRSKRLIVTRSDEGIKDMSRITHPHILDYAFKCNADFKELSDGSAYTAERESHYRIMRIYDYLDEYDRVLCLDTDVLISPDCPDLFDIVREDCIGTVFEDKGSRQLDRINRIEHVQREWGEVHWSHGYPNTGVFMVSKCHEKIFSAWKGRYWTNAGWDDVHFGWQIRRLGLKVQELPYLFNHMSMFSEPWNGSPDRFKSHIIHYAGNGDFSDKGSRTRLELMSDDEKKMYN